MAATKVQATIRAWRKRRGTSGRWRVPMPRLRFWQWTGLVAGLAGFVDGRWAMPCLIVFGILTWWTWRHRGGGLDGVSTLDAKLEQQLPGFMGSTARGYYRTRLAGITARFAVMGTAAAYLLGALARSRL